jgi:molybdopterin converting factor small subunit
MIQVELKLYGIFRKYKESSSILLNLAGPCGINDLKKEIKAFFDSRNPELNLGDVVVESAIANNDSILPLDYTIQKNTTLVILPPVCGG